LITKIPLEVLNLHDDGFHLLVEVVVYGQSFKAVLDTGASKTVFDKSTIMELNGEVSIIRLSDRVSTGLGTNSMESFTVVLPEIAIGTLVISGFEAAVIDLSSINYAYEQLGLPKVIGVIGGDILMDHKAVIDYGKKMLKLFVL
jgi:hypothetical protein